MKLIVKAVVRYWEDAIVNGVEDENGSLIPHRKGECWCPVIDLETGTIEEWPECMADVHYKVCDAGEYYLSTDDGRLLKYKGDYVPDAFLCHGDDGYGDYIIMKIGTDGKILDYRKPIFDPHEWEVVR